MSSESEVESGFESEDEIDYDSDSALQDAFAKGLLKPGLNTVSEKTHRIYKNDQAELKRKLAEIKLALPWAERLDLVNDLAPLAPELALKLEETQQKREVFIRNHNANKRQLNKMSTADDPVLNEFRREMTFHRQAQGAVLAGIPQLVAAGVLSKRPTDYFAQMAKSDQHMQKVRQVLMNKQNAAQRSDRAKQQRQTKKMAREAQIASKLKKINDKREMLGEVKKYRKGVRKDLDFLEDKKKAVQKKPGANNNQNRRIGEKRKFKEKKFGYGGKKAGGKRNTKASYAEAEGGRGGRGKGGGAKGGKGKAGKQARPGKSKRQKGKR